METTLLLKEAMTELKDIKQELMKMNTALTLTIERQSVAANSLEDLAKKVSACEKHIVNCPAKKAHESKVFLVKDFSAVLALILSVIALMNIFL